MTVLAKTFGRASVRPYLLLVLVAVGLSLLDLGNGSFLSVATVFSSLQAFATIGLVALGLGLTMLIGEFDLSVAGVFGLAGCAAVLIGNENPALGLACAAAVGIAFGLCQGVIIGWLGLGSVPVTLGGLLTANGLAYVLTENRTLSFDNLPLALALNAQIASVFSMRSLVVLAVFAIAAGIFAATRLGRDLIAVGSDRRAAMVSGVAVKRLTAGSFAVSGLLAAMSGAMLSYGLASASPAGLADVLVPAVAAAILGGVSLSGGMGRPLGIAAGVLTLMVLRSGLNALAAPPFVHDVATGMVLLFVAIADAPKAWRLRPASFSRRRAEHPR